MEDYTPIEGHGMIGNMLTVALVTTDGAIDWMCYPHFDSPAIFCAILDKDKGGFYSIRPSKDDYRTKQMYSPETNVLVTKFMSKEGVANLIDYMPIITYTDCPTKVKQYALGHKWLIRRITVVRGKMDFKFECRPAFNFARDPHQTAQIDDHTITFTSNGVTMSLHSECKMSVNEAHKSAEGHVTVSQGETLSFIFRDTGDNFMKHVQGHFDQYFPQMDDSNNDDDDEDGDGDGEGEDGEDGDDKGGALDHHPTLGEKAERQRRREAEAHRDSTHNIVITGNESNRRDVEKKDDEDGKKGDDKQPVNDTIKTHNDNNIDIKFTLPLADTTEKKIQHGGTWSSSSSSSSSTLSQKGNTNNNRRRHRNLSRELVLMIKYENRLFDNTVRYWQKWLSKCTYKGRWREVVERSALALKLMTFVPTGAIVASPTCSLPESVGGGRNWDYRYVWLRDAAFTIYAFMRIGFDEEATAFMGWVEERCKHTEEAAKLGEMPLLIMYSIDGGMKLPETELHHLSGYKNSPPVRIGNDAAHQVQLDIFGELLDSVYLYNKYGELVSYDFWTHLVKLLEWLADHWRDKDEGVWEVRSGRQHFVYSKLMCWVAFDRGLRLADRRSFPAPRAKWYQIRDEIYEDIMKHGWCENKKILSQYYGSDELDASVLIAPLVFFIAPNDPRMLSTIKAIMKKPKEGGLVSNSLVFRYDTSKSADGLEGEEGTFNICTFWLIEAMTRAGATTTTTTQRHDSHTSLSSLSSSSAPSSSSSTSSSTSPAKNSSSNTNNKDNKERNHDKDTNDDDDDGNMLNRARFMFEEMLAYANHLGLYGEETGLAGDSLGNFPQAFTHLSLISCAFNLDRALGKNGSR
eukprot:TRINITY_DN8729_c0_g1_i1.p1 TRINITY_DN8729_c0_g1~~TRINITY_DN8729_c0_g1_i1.p1  ORF type:complete len:857 (+),score=159.57 TRINITY_DN8729_c0_g1_i1:56-2626(+)